MSNARRFPNSSQSRQRRGTPGPTSHQWASWDNPTPGPCGTSHSHHIPTPAQPNYCHDGWNRGTPGAHSTPWGAGDHENWGNTGYIPLRPIPIIPNNNTNNNCPMNNTGPAGGPGNHEFINKFYQPASQSLLYGNNYNILNHIDHQQKRLNWRDQILRGQPEQLINESLTDAHKLVITFISRGSIDHPHGQGLELLRFRPPRRPHQFSNTTAPDTRAGWVHFAMDACPLIKVKEEDIVLSSNELSTKPFSFLLSNLDVKKDLKLVRKSKPLLWDNTTVLESFLYRLVEEKEKPDSDAANDLDERLGGPNLYGWYQISELLSLTTTPESDLVCTALNAVCFPPNLNLAIDSILADQESRIDQIVLKALDVFYFCIQNKFARMAFKFYPIPPPPPNHLEHLVCDKRRVWAYWTEVLAWHLSHLRDDTQVSISYSLSKALSDVRDAVDDEKVDLDHLDQIMIASIAMEANRSRSVTNKIIHDATLACLHNPTFAPTEANSLNKMHIITSGTSLLVYGVISELISEVLSPKISQSGVNGKIMDLRITIAESRPLSEGVILASKLVDAVDSCMEYLGSSSKQNKRASRVPSTSDMKNPLLDPDIQSRFARGMSEREQLHNATRLQPPSLGLYGLLDGLDALKEKKDPKVSIEVITDAAVVSTIMASGNSGIKPIILLSADRILPNGDSVNRVGSAQMAWAGKRSKGVVLILCRGDRIHSKELAAPIKPKNPSEELISGWKSSVPERALQTILNSRSSDHVEINNPIFEDVDHHDISSYITEIGIMQHDKLTDFSEMRSELENIVWPVNALTKI